MINISTYIGLCLNIKSGTTEMLQYLLKIKLCVDDLKITDLETITEVDCLSSTLQSPDLFAQHETILAISTAAPFWSMLEKCDWLIRCNWFLMGLSYLEWRAAWCRVQHVSDQVDNGNSRNLFPGLVIQLKTETNRLYEIKYLDI